MNILCKFGFHKASKTKYMHTYNSNGKHKWFSNHAVCKRCGKRLHKVRIDRNGQIMKAANGKENTLRETD